MHSPNVQRMKFHFVKCFCITIQYDIVKEHFQLSFRKNMAKKVHPEKVGHPVFMILAYPITKSNGKRSRQSLFFHYMPSEGEGSSRKKRGSEASRVRDTWIHAIFTTFFTGSDDQQLPVDVWTNGPSQVTRNQNLDPDLLFDSFN